MRFEFKNNHLATVVMILSFMYGGVSLFFFVFQIATVGTIPEMGPIMGTGIANGSHGFIDATNQTNMTEAGRGFFRAPDRLESRAKDFFYALVSISLIGSVVSILAGISLFLMLRKTERKSITKSMIDTLTTPEEKLAIEELQSKGGEMTQSELVKLTGLSKVKVHRVVKRLEELGVIRKYPYGMTNKLRLTLKKDIL
jgi:hypothetical protein